MQALTNLYIQIFSYPNTHGSTNLAKALALLLQKTETHSKIDLNDSTEYME